jgi:hypothetical protein
MIFLVGITCFILPAVSYASDRFNKLLQVLQVHTQGSQTDDEGHLAPRH